MKVIDHRPGGDPSCIRLAEAEKPVPKAGEVVIQVAYAGVNRPDILQRTGSYPPPPDASPYMGLEVSGTIVAVGDGVPSQRIGEEVCALTPGGGYAEFVVAPAGHCMPIPAGVDLRTAACLPETFLTAAIGCAKWAGASRIFTTVGSEDKARVCRQLGADRPILYKSEDFAQVIKDETNGIGVNLVLDMVGGDYLPKHLKCLALEGRLVQIAFLSGAKVEMDWTLLMMKRLTFTGSTLRARSIEEKARLALTMQQAIWPELQKGRLLPIVHAEFPLEQAEQAHRLMESSQHVGKIVLKVS